MKKTMNLLLTFMVATAIAGCASNTDSGISDLTAQNVKNADENASEDIISSEVTDDTEWTVIFEDDFEGPSSVPDQDKWVLCERSKSTWARYLSESYDQAYQKDGSLYLVGELVDGEYKTGGIETRGKFDFQYGKVECRARFLRRPQGNHTGIWMMPAPPAEQWPKSGEIDIMEHLNNESLIYETIHSWYSDDMGHKDDPRSQNEVTVNAEDWNTYGIIWTSESITFTVNGEEHFIYSNLHLDGDNAQWQWPFDHPFYIILSQSLGGKDTWEGEIVDSELPAIFEIDWIKVMKDASSEGSGVPQIRM